MKKLIIPIALTLAVAGCSTTEETALIARMNASMVQAQSVANVPLFKIECGVSMDSCSGLKFAYSPPPKAPVFQRITTNNDVLMHSVKPIANMVGWAVGAYAGSKVLTSLAENMGNGNTSTSVNNHVTGDSNSISSDFGSNIEESSNSTDTASTSTNTSTDSNDVATTDNNSDNSTHSAVDDNSDSSTVSNTDNNSDNSTHSAVDDNSAVTTNTDNNSDNSTVTTNTDDNSINSSYNPSTTGAE